jgi:hypothetical protein
MILLTLMSLLITAAVFYLPNHVLVVSNRIWYYIHGEFYETLSEAVPSTTEAAKSAATALSGSRAAQMLSQTAEQVLRAKNEL